MYGCCNAYVIKIEVNAVIICMYFSQYMLKKYPLIVRPLSHGHIAPSIPAEPADDRSVSAHCAGTDLSERRSPLWGIG